MLTGTIITIVTLGILGAVFYFVVRPMLKQANSLMGDAKNMMAAQTAASNLRVTGQPAQAKVLNVQPTGTMINYQPQCQVSLEVQPSAGQPYQVAFLSVINQVVMPRVQPGAMVPVKVDPANPMNVALDM